MLFCPPIQPDLKVKNVHSEAMLPQLDRLLSSASFDPEQEMATFRIAATDNACQVLCPVLCCEFIRPASKVSLNFIAWHDGTYEALERGRLDLALNADGWIDSTSPS